MQIADITDFVSGKRENSRFGANPEYDGHERIVWLQNTELDFRAVIAIHNTARGAALGGCRYRTDYPSEAEAITDVLRLSKGMTYKNALAGLDLGGGKAVIMGAPDRPKPGPGIMEALAAGIGSLEGRYVTAEDMNTSEADMLRVWSITRHVSGIPLAKVAPERFSPEFDLSSLPHANPSPYTAAGTLAGIRAAVKHRLGRESLEGVRVAVKGAAGSVGALLCRMLAKEKALLIVSDRDGHAEAQARLGALARELGAQTTDSGSIAAADADVFAPCARGGDIDDGTVPLLKAAIVAGCANNVLSAPRHAAMLQERNILYAPDYAINAGGVISVGLQHLWLAHPGKYPVPTHDGMMRRAEEIERTLAGIFGTADRTGQDTAAVADAAAEAAFAARPSDAAA